jgi:hypothetical protein
MLLRQRGPVGPAAVLGPDGRSRDPADDEQYIVRLVGQVVRVSVETARIVKALPVAFA